MWSKLLRLAAPGAAAFLLGLAATGDAAAQGRGNVNIPIGGGSGQGGIRPGVNIGPSGISVGPSYSSRPTYTPNVNAPGAYNPNTGTYNPNRGYYNPNTGYYSNYPPGTTYVNPQQPATVYTPAPSTVNTAPTLVASQDRAVMNVRVPANARVFIGNNEQTSQTGSSRQFVSPPLQPGSAYQYEFRAQWMENGQPVERTRNVTIHAGDRVTIDFMQGS